VIELLLLADSLENMFESIASSLTQLTLESKPNNITGQAAFPVTFANVRWEWLILPVVLEAAGITLLLFTMVQTKHTEVPLWRASVLAFLYHGLEEGLKDGQATAKVSGMDMDAKKVRVRLKPSEKEDWSQREDGWVLGT
jgi:hypothetical protein